MSKKLFISLAPLLATVAFVAMPTVAQAVTPEYYVDNNNSPVVKVPYVSWGKLALTNSLGGTPVSCENEVGGWVEQGGKNEETEGWVAYNCTDEECELAGGKIAVIFENENDPQSAPVRLDWPGVIEGTAPLKVRLKSTNIKVYVHCEFVSLPYEEKPGEGALKGLELRVDVQANAPGAVSCSAGTGGGTSTPKVTNGPKYNYGNLTFTGGVGGELVCSNSGKGITTGTLHTMGFNGFEDIEVH